jgi:hypothetical protein
VELEQTGAFMKVLYERRLALLFPLVVFRMPAP